MAWLARFDFAKMVTDFNSLFLDRGQPVTVKRLPTVASITGGSYGEASMTWASVSMEFGIIRPMDQRRGRSPATLEVGGIQYLVTHIIEMSAGSKAQINDRIYPTATEFYYAAGRDVLHSHVIIKATDKGPIQP